MTPESCCHSDRTPLSCLGSKRTYTRAMAYEPQRPACRHPRTLTPYDRRYQSNSRPQEKLCPRCRQRETSSQTSAAPEITKPGLRITHPGECNATWLTPRSRSSERVRLVTSWSWLEHNPQRPQDCDHHKNSVNVISRHSYSPWTTQKEGSVLAPL